MDQGRGGLLSAGGILSIIVGAFEVIGGAGIVALFAGSFFRKMHEPPFFPGFPGSPFGAEFNVAAVYHWLTVMGIILGILGIIAIVGGISAIRRSSFGLSLAGGICALLPLNLAGLWAVIFVSLGKGEFE